MGIPGFQKWLLGSFPEIVRVQGSKFGQVYDHGECRVVLYRFVRYTPRLFSSFAGPDLRFYLLNTYL